MEAVSGRMAALTKVRGVLFDLDDTLYDRRAAFRNWGEIFLRERLGIDADGECAEIMAWMESLDANGYGSKHAVIVELYGRFPQAAGTVESFYDEFVERIALDPPAAGLLDHLDAIGVPYGIVTNGSERQWRKIDTLRLAERTSAILVSDTFGAKKPDAAIFVAAAKSLQVDPREILFIGDHPVNDVAGARAAGMLTAWLHRGRPWPRELDHADVTIASLDEIRPLLG